MGSKFIGTKKLILLWTTLLMLSLACEAQDDRRSRRVSVSAAPSLEIHLGDLGYKGVREYKYPGNGISSDLSILNDDSKKRLTFIDEKTLVVYQSHYQTQVQKEGSPESRSLEAFFVNPQTGGLISRKTWPTVKRRWLNERWDTQARIMAVNGGYLVHASNLLALYSTGLELKRKIALEDGPRWAVSVAPLGRTFHLQRIQDDNQAEGEWFDSDTLVKLRSQYEMAGVTSASDQAIVDKLAHCVQLQRVGETPRNLYCADASHLGLPLFLSDSEVLSVHGKGFALFSTDGEKLWGREVPDARPVANHKRSLNGGRFGILIRGRAAFDQVDVPKEQSAIFVYDRSTRARIFLLILGHGESVSDFDLCPNGSMLAVLVGETVRLYKLPSL